MHLARPATLALIINLVLIYPHILQGGPALQRELFDGVAAPLPTVAFVREFSRVHAEVEALILPALEPVKPPVLETFHYHRARMRRKARA